jgi:pyridoxal 5'-phosphate synthase pdxT subunit
VAGLPRIGVLAVQGNVREHVSVLRRLGAEAIEVRKPEELAGLAGLVIPGGESTTFMRLMRLYGLDEAIRHFPGPVLGTCAGMIVLDRAHLGLVDIEVARNAYGRQVASFEADLELTGESEPLRGVFIRAPRVHETGPDVEVLAEHDGEPVLLRDGRFLVASFHPELTDDSRVHKLFLDLVHDTPSPFSDAPLGVRRAEGQNENTAVRVERGQRGEAGGAGLRPAGAGRSEERDVRA